MSNLYALLVGIDRYPTKPLQGCVNDVLAWESYLKSLTGENELRLECLLDERATRTAMIEAFRSHLVAARKGDTALFYFSGHGSQELAPAPYREEEPGGLSETLLAYDSRSTDGLDIADKELAVLITEVALGGAHVVVILDSCHSGTATRDPTEETRIRRMACQGWPREEGSYWFHQETDLPAKLEVAGGWRVLPQGPHILLAACADYQLARECSTPDGVKRGLFSFCLLDSLKRLGPAVSYRELHKRAQIRVSNLWSDQIPQAEGDLERIFLDGLAPPRPRTYHVQAVQEGIWRLDAGAAHGIQDDCEIAVLPPGGQGPQDLSRRLATARVVETGGGSSLLELVEGSLPVAVSAYPAILTHLPAPPLRITVEELDRGRDGGVLGGIETSPYLSLAASSSAAEILLRRDTAGYHLRRPGAVGELCEPLPADRPETLIATLEQIARWQAIAELASPASSLTDMLTMEIHERLPADPDRPGHEPQTRLLTGGGELHLPYRETPSGGPTPRRFCVRLGNGSESALHYALLGLDERFSVQVIRNTSGRLPAGDSVWLRRSDGIDASVPERLHRRGVTRRRDLLVLLASTEPVDFQLLAQGPLGAPGPARETRRRGGRPPGSLGALLRSRGWRETDQHPLLDHQWVARVETVVSHRPMPWRKLSGAGEVVELVSGVRLRAPRGLIGAVRLQGDAPGAPDRALASPRFPGDEHLELRPVSLAGALGNDPGLSVLALRVDDHTAVSSSSPLVLETGLSLGPEEALVAVSQDRPDIEPLPLTEDPHRPDRCVIPSLPRPTGESLWIKLYAGRRAGDRGHGPDR